MSQVLEFASSVVKNLPEVPEEVRKWWIENPLDLQAALGVLSQKPSPKLEVFKTIKLGTGLKNAHDFRNDFKGNSLNVSDWAYSMMENPAFVVAAEATEVDLVVVSVGELGFKKGARRDQIYERAKELGLELCPPEVGPQLRRQYADQPLNEWLIIGMEPIRDSGGGLSVFNVVHDAGGLWLAGDCGRPAYVWGAGIRWVFVRPRKCLK